MRRIKVTFYVTLGILALAGVFHLGARTAVGQTPENPVVALTRGSGSIHHALTANGDFYTTSDGGATWSFAGNVFGGHVSTSSTTWGRIKADRR